MRKKIIIGLIILFALVGIIAVGFWFFKKYNNDTGPIRAEKMKRIGNHIYYSEDMYALRKADKDTKEEFLNYLEELDKNIDYDIYVCGTYRSAINKDLCINAYQYLNGAVIPNVFYRSDNYSDEPRILLSDREAPVNSFDTSDLVPASEIVDDVLQLTEQHKDELYFDDYNNKEIVGTYRLEYDTYSNSLYYRFDINETSEVRIDAKTGQIIYEYFWDGTIVD